MTALLCLLLFVRGSSHLGGDLRGDHHRHVLLPIVQ